MTPLRADRLLDLLCVHDNDWSAEAATWSRHSADPLEGDVTRTPACDVTVNTTVSVIVTAFNVAPSIIPLLRALELSSLNQRRPDLLEVIVVDDGSTDDTWNLVTAFGGDLTTRAVHLDHCGKAKAMNTGLAISVGDIIVALDGDMVLNHWALEEMARRHQVLPAILLTGFRSNLWPGDPQLAAVVNGAIEPLLVHRYADDNRFVFDTPGWPDNIFLDSGAFRSMGENRRFWMSSGQTWDLPRSVYGCLFSVRRTTLEAFAGYDERNYGWGWEDTTIGAQVIGQGHKVVPLVTANGAHVKHPPRSANRWDEGRHNRLLYHDVLRSPVPPANDRVFREARDRVRREVIQASRRGPGPAVSASLKLPDDPVDRARQFALAGHDRQASALITAYVGEREDAAILLAGIRWRAGNPAEALAILGAAPGGGRSLASARERAFALAADGRFRSAHAAFSALYQRDPLERLVRYAFKMPAYRHRRHADKHARAGFVSVARRDLEAALSQEPADLTTWEHWERLRCSECD